VTPDAAITSLGMRLDRIERRLDPID